MIPPAVGNCLIVMVMLLLFLLGLVIVTVLYLISFWASSTKRTIEKLSAYECGFNPVGDTHINFEIVYYVIGILYLIFDLEIIFLFPLAVL